MGSIGDIFPYANPVIGSTDWPNWILCMDELITRVSNDIPISSISGAILDMDNNSIINVKDIQFIDGGVALPTTPGLMEFHNDEFWFITSAGAIQITSAGSLNIAIVGGIGGDYGGANPAAVNFVDAAKRYDFYDDFGGQAWAYGRFRGVDIANGAAGTKIARIVYGGAADVTLTLPPTLPAANRSMLQISTTGAITFNASATPLTNDIVLDGTTKIQHGDRVFNAVPTGATANIVSQGAFTPVLAGYVTDTLAAGHAIIYLVPTNLPVGINIKSVGVQVNKADGTFCNTEIFTTVAGSPTAVSLGTGTSNGSGLTVITATVGGGYTTVTGFGITLVVDSAAVGDSFGNLIITYNQPA